MKWKVLQSRTDIFLSVQKDLLILNMKKKKSYVMYQCLLHLDSSELYSSPYLKEIRSILNNCGLAWAWLSQEVPNPAWLGKAVQQNFKDQWMDISLAQQS